jgi:hypothetical protein
MLSPRSGSVTSMASPHSVPPGLARAVPAMHVVE